MVQYLRSLAAVLTRYFDHLRGERTTKIVYQASTPHEAYKAIMDDGAYVDLYCVETVYQIRFSKWWVPTETHRVYRVYGVCDPRIPEDFANYVSRGFYIGPLLPPTAARADQKKAAIHAMISLLLDELKRSKSSGQKRA